MPGNSAILEGDPAALYTANLLNTVALKWPPFWLDNIEGWLVQSESQFRLKGLQPANLTTWCSLCLRLTLSIKVLYLIRAPPADNPNGHLNEGLLQMYALTDYAHYKALSSLPLPGDMLPSALMLKMLALLPSDHQACFFFHGAFL